GRATETLQIDFASSYPAGRSLSVTVEARTATEILAHGSTTSELRAGCSTMVVTLTEGALPDMAEAADLTTVDLEQQAPDLSTLLDLADRDAQKGLGGSCSVAGECISNFCVDGVCCDRACDAQCEACGSNGVCGTISGAPRGSRPACTGAGGLCG